MGPGGGGPTLWLAQQDGGRRGRASNSAQDGELAVERPPGHHHLKYRKPPNESSVTSENHFTESQKAVSRLAFTGGPSSLRCRSQRGLGRGTGKGGEGSGRYRFRGLSKLQSRRHSRGDTVKGIVTVLHGDR